MRLDPGPRTHDPWQFLLIPEEEWSNGYLKQATTILFQVTFETQSQTSVAAHEHSRKNTKIEANLYNVKRSYDLDEELYKPPHFLNYIWSEKILHEQQQIISMQNNVRELSHVLLVNTQCSYLHSLCTTGVTGGLATRMFMTQTSRGSWESLSHGSGPDSALIFVLLYVIVLGFCFKLYTLYFVWSSHCPNPLYICRHPITLYLIILIIYGEV